MKFSEFDKIAPIKSACDPCQPSPLKGKTLEATGIPNVFIEVDDYGLAHYATITEDGRVERLNDYGMWD